MSAALIGPRTFENLCSLVEGLVNTRAIRHDGATIRLAVIVLASLPQGPEVVQFRLNPDFCRMLVGLADHRGIPAF